MRFSLPPPCPPPLPLCGVGWGEGVGVHSVTKFDSNCEKGSILYLEKNRLFVQKGREFSQIPIAVLEAFSEQIRCSRCEMMCGVSVY